MHKTVPNVNIARYLPQQARERPNQVAVVKGSGRDAHGHPRYEQLTYAELEQRSNALAWGISGYGIGQGTRVLLMVPAGLPLLALTFALFKIGAVPILIDPAMGRQNMARCIEECAPEAMIGIARAHLLRLVAPKAFASTRHFVYAEGRAGPGGVALGTLEGYGAQFEAPFPLAVVAADTLAAIAFTTGSTGVPKGVVYEYGMFQTQCELLRDYYQIQPGEIEMPAFPLFALFNVALGVTSAIPPIDPTRPAACDPAEVVEFMNDQQVTSTFGSPAIWNKVTAFCVEQRVRLPSLRRVLMAGAPVPIELHRRFQQVLPPEGNTYTPYGATEALPITSISGREVMQAHAERANPTAGTCVGRAVPGVRLCIIPTSDEPIDAWNESLPLHPFEVGEIVVRGAMVTKRYLNRPESTQLAKIPDGDQVWHRMGDLGYLDHAGRVWFYGRKPHRVETGNATLYTEPVELVFNQHPQVARSALVGVRDGSHQRPVVVIEPLPGAMPRTDAERAAFRAELHALGAQYPMTESIDLFLFHPSFPVDIRHNAKIFREQLAAWAASSNEL